MNILLNRKGLEDISIDIYGWSLYLMSFILWHFIFDTSYFQIEQDVSYLDTRASWFTIAPDSLTTVNVRATCWRKHMDKG